MFRIHPTAENRCKGLWKKIMIDQHDPCPSVQLTVWKRSSMSFQGTDGFTVFDGHGRLAFRVDNYTRKSSSLCVPGRGGSGDSLVLMDGSGKPLLTLRPQIFSMQYQWNGYRGDHECGIKCRVFEMRRPSVLIHRRSACEAEVFMERVGVGPTTKREGRTPPDFRIEGSFRRRNCKMIKNPSGELAAKMARKRASHTSCASTILLSDEVFSLVIQPGFDPELIMAFVIILDRICGKPFAPHVLCS